MNDAGRSGTHGLKEELGRHRGGRGVCCMGMNVRVFVMYCENVQHIVLLELQNLQVCLGDSFSHFEAMNSSDKASFILGSELGQEHFQSLLALVKKYEILKERKSKVYVLTNPVFSFQLTILGILLGGMVSDCVREVNLARVS